MDTWWSILGLATAVASAFALYAGSSHCRWPVPGGHSRVTVVIGMLLAAASWLTWTLARGPAVGLCAMLATWMLALIASPWLALLVPTGSDTSDGRA